MNFDYPIYVRAYLWIGHGSMSHLAKPQSSAVSLAFGYGMG